MRGMEPKENSGIVDWPAGASNRSGKAELQSEREVVEGFGRVIEDGMSSDRNSNSIDLAGSTWLRDQRPVDKGKASRSGRSPALERPLGTIEQRLEAGIDFRDAGQRDQPLRRAPAERDAWQHRIWRAHGRPHRGADDVDVVELPDAAGIVRDGGVDLLSHP